MTGQPGSPPSILQSTITRLGFKSSRGLDLQETISCLTVRDISDYSDGHKNDE